ncbi:hypothetical protein [Streptomyces sp. NPDC052114]|uniref:hypothetical protein n=1 Tax=unclassified Streptomyces TaxID=2593676 RepID=UPI0034484767
MRCDPTQLPGLLNSLLQATEQADPTHCTAAALKDLQRQRRSLRAHIRTELLRFLFPSHSLPPGFPPIQSLPGPEETRHALTTATNPSFTVIGGDHCPPLRTDAIRRSEPRTEFHRALPFHREAPRPTSPVLVPLPGHPGASVRLAAFPPDPDAARPGTPAWASFTLANTLLTDPRGSFLTDAVRHHSYVLDGVLDEDHTMTMLVAEPDPQDLSPFLNALHTALRAFAAVTPSNAAVQAAAHRHLTQEALHLTALESLADRLAALQGRGSPPETLLAHWEAVRHITVEDISHVTQHLGPDSFSGIVLADPALLPPNEPLRMNP